MSTNKGLQEKLDRENDGGPAFPVYPRHAGYEVREVKDAVGMTLLDWFAGQALASGNCPDNYLHADSAAWAYREAYAMLKARQSHDR